MFMMYILNKRMKKIKGVALLLNANLIFADSNKNP